MLVEKHNAKAVVGSLSNHEGDGDKNVTNWTFNNEEKAFSAPCTPFIHFAVNCSRSFHDAKTNSFAVDDVSILLRTFIFFFL